MSGPQENNGGTHKQYSAVLWSIALGTWTGVTVGYTRQLSEYATLIVDAIVPAAGSTVALGPTASQQFVGNSDTIVTTAPAGSVLVVVVNAETTSGSWDVASLTASGLTFTRRADVTDAAIYSGTGIQRSQVWWAPVTTAFSGGIAVGLTASADAATLHAFCVEGANLTTPFDGTAVTATGSGTLGTITTAFSTTHPGAFVYAVGANPDGDIMWQGYLPVGNPAITSVTPNSGVSLGGDTITIDGKYFTTASAVSFGSTAATSFVVSSDTQIVAVSPAESAALVDITVTNSGATSSVVVADEFQVFDPVTFRAGSTGYNSVTIPSAVQIGDQMLIFCYGSFASAPSPTGWTTIKGPTATGPGMNGVALSRVVQGGDAGTLVSLPRGLRSALVAYKNVASIDVSTEAFVASPGFSTNPISPAATTTTTHETVVYSWGLESVPTAWPSALTLREAY